MAVFYIKKKHTMHTVIISIAVSATLIIMLAVMSGRILSSNESEQQIILENAVSRSITECYALDGAYPPDINYLVEHYGLTYDNSRYFIDYQYIGANIPPDVTIIRRK